MIFSSKTLGFFQAAGLALYVIVFAASVQWFQQWLVIQNVHINPAFSIALFLLVFVISAIICGSLIFAYPILLFFDGKKDKAISIVFWSAVWLIALFIIFIAIGFMILF